MNAAGDVVGVAYSKPPGHLREDEQTFAYIHGQLREVSLSVRPAACHGLFFYVAGIDDAGDVIGHFWCGRSYIPHGFVLRGGVTRELRSPYGLGFYPRATSASGVIVGSGRTGSTYKDSEVHAFRYTNFVAFDLGTLGGLRSDARAINDAGQIVGDSTVRLSRIHAFPFSDGVMTDLGTLGGHFSSAHGINVAGLVVGEADAANGRRHAFLYEAGVMRDLGALGAWESVAQSINSHADIVGHNVMQRRFLTTETRAFLYRQGAMTDLNSHLIGPLAPYVTLTTAVAINDAGQIAANGVDSRVKRERAYLLTPVDGGSAP